MRSFVWVCERIRVCVYGYVCKMLNEPLRKHI